MGQPYGFGETYWYSGQLDIVDFRRDQRGGGDIVCGLALIWTYIML